MINNIRTERSPDLSVCRYRVRAQHASVPERRCWHGFPAALRVVRLAFFPVLKEVSQGITGFGQYSGPW